MFLSNSVWSPEDRSAAELSSRNLDGRQMGHITERPLLRFESSLSYHYRSTKGKKKVVRTTHKSKRRKFSWQSDPNSFASHWALNS